MKSNGICLLGLCAMTLVGLAALMPVASAADAAPAAEAMGWRIGCQLWSFNRFTFVEAIDKVSSLGLKYAEAFPGQRLSPDLPEDVKFEHTMSEEHRALAQSVLKEKGVSVVAYGVTGIPKDEAEARELFAFAKAMGIEVITSEPPKSVMDLVGKLADEYDIKVAIHNHPKPSMYYDYKKVLAAVEGRTARIGSCADTGHWMRSGIDPLEAVKALEGRIVSFHLKDLGEFDVRDAHDVVWGTGMADLKGILAEVQRQQLKPIFSIEYEYNWDNNLPDIAACVKYFNEVAAELSAAAK
jgi:sugar phosphate isomerase/epimerase